MKQLAAIKVALGVAIVCLILPAHCESLPTNKAVGVLAMQSDTHTKASRKLIAKPRYQLLQDFPYEPLSEVCEAFTDMLNAFGPQEPQMRCEQKLHPGFPEFKAVELQEQPSKDNFKYYSAIRDLANRETIKRGFTPYPLRPGDLEKEFELYERLGGYKYYLTTTDRFIEGKSIILLIQERQGDCRIADGMHANVSRNAYEWNAAIGQVVTHRFAFQSMFTYEGKSMQGDGLLTSYWSEADVSDKPPGKFGSIWVRQANGRGAQSRICTILFNDKR